MLQAGLSEAKPSMITYPTASEAVVSRRSTQPLEIKMVRFILLCLFVLNANAASAQDWKAEMIDYGVYAVSVGKKVEDENVAGGLRLSYGERLIKSTDQVDAIIGTSFGYRYRLNGPVSNVRVTIKVSHPALHDPSTGKEFQTSEWSQIVPAGTVNWNTGWVFDHDWEIMPGEWTLKLYIADKKLFEKSFVVRDGRSDHSKAAKLGSPAYRAINNPDME
jgi:hypothetical protein